MKRYTISGTVTYKFKKVIDARRDSNLDEIVADTFDFADIEPSSEEIEIDDVEESEVVDE